MCDITTGAPEDFALEDIAAAARLVKLGGALPASEKVLVGRLKRSRELAFCRNRSQVIGVASIKAPGREYRRRVFRKAAVTLSGFSCAPELGYVTVHNNWRGQGIAKILVQSVLRNISEPCYATTDDSSMKAILEKLGFSMQGKEWNGQRGLLSLWTRY